MSRRTLYGVAGGIIFLVIGALIGFLIGTYIGGNYYPDFELWTWRGYEAIGWIGIIVGGLLGALLGYRIGLRVAYNRGV